MNQEQYQELFLSLTAVDAAGIRRWNVSQEVVDPYDFELAGMPVWDDQVNAYLHYQIDQYEKENQ